MQDYIVSFRLAWTTEEDPVSENKTYNLYFVPHSRIYPEAEVIQQTKGGEEGKQSLNCKAFGISYS